MSGFFSDNQTKQKAYDRYYNQVAKSNYVQGRKLRAISAQEGVDEASTDSLATLFQKAMMKSHDYEYDQITRKLIQRAPAVLSDSKQSKAKPVRQLKVNVKGKKKKRKYVPEVTDTDIMMTPPRRKSSEKKIEQEINENDQVMPLVESPPRTPQNKVEKPFRPSVTMNIKKRAASKDVSSEEEKKDPFEGMLRPPVTMNIKEKVSEEEDNYFDALFGTDSTVRVDKDELNKKLEDNGGDEALNKVIFNIGEAAVKEELGSKSKGKNNGKKKLNTKSMKASLKLKVGDVLIEKRFKYLDKNEKKNSD